MPVVDGFEVLDFMIKEHWNEEIPVIMISSENSPDTMQKSIRDGRCRLYQSAIWMQE